MEKRDPDVDEQLHFAALHIRAERAGFKLQRGGGSDIEIMKPGPAPGTNWICVAVGTLEQIAADLCELEADRDDVEVGVKYDSGKIRPDLIPPTAIRQAAAVLGYGAAKYGDDNWQKHDVYEGQQRHVAAMLRHLTAWQMGEAFDSESGLHHLSHVLANAAFVVWAEDRKGEPLPETWNTPPRPPAAHDGVERLSRWSPPQSTGCVPDATGDAGDE